MKKAGIFLAISVLLAGCASLDNGSISNGRYVANNNAFSMEVPNLISVDTKDVSRNEISMVLFTSGTYYWMMDGQYEVDIIDLTKMEKPQVKLDAALAYGLPKVMNTMITQERKGTIQSQQCKFTTVKNTRAYQCIAKAVIDQTPAMMVGTAFYMKNNIVNVFAIEPDNRPFRWERYNSLINSIQIN